MNFEREDFDAARPPKNGAAQPDRRNLQMIQQAGLSAQMLTGDQHWDKYLSYLEAARQNNAKQRDAYMNELASPLLVNSDEVQKRRIAIIRLNERIEVLSYVMALPSHLIRLGGQADAQLEKLSDVQV